MQEYLCAWTDNDDKYTTDLQNCEQKEDADKCLVHTKKVTIKSSDLRIKFCPTLFLYLSPQLVGLFHHVNIKWLNIRSSGNT